MSTRVRGSAGLTLLLLAWTLPPAAAAQLQLQVTPYFASHFPLRQFNEFKDQVNNRTGHDKQTNSAALGGKITVWLNPAWGVEGDFNYAWSGVIETYEPAVIANSTSFNLKGNQINATGRLVFRPRRSNLMLGVGAGVIHRSGDAWDEGNFPGSTIKFNNTNFTTVASIGTRAQVTPRFAILVAVDALLYSVEKFEVGGAVVDPGERKKFQADLQIKLGVPIGAR